MATELASPIVQIEEAMHPGILCNNCGHGIRDARFVCLHCDDINHCETCHQTPQVQQRHDLSKTHVWAKIKDSRNLSFEKLQNYKNTARTKGLDFDPYAFHTWHKEELQNSEDALNLVKEMLRQENSYRLGEHYQAEYKKSQSDDHKTKVTVEIQERVVNEFMVQANGIYKDLNEGLNFLRAAVGNFGEKHLADLMECANYVKYTQVCVRGPLRVGDKVDCTQIPLYHPVTGAKELLSDWIKDDKPLVILGSSYT
jgi:hypothetical protein